MSSIKSDPLLMAGKLITYIGQALMAIATIGILIGLPVFFFFQERIQDEWQADMGTTAAFPVLGIIGLMVLGLVAVVLVFLFLGKLRQIINTVGEGDPFVPENAERLTAMAWMMLAIQMLVVPLIAIAIFLQKVLEETNAEMDAQIDLSGIILVIMLFILARVFRHGTAMREDLEGTV